CGPTDLGDPNYYAQGMDLKTEFLPLMEKAAGQTVTEENLRAVTAPFSPVTYVSTAVPTVIAHGKKDTVVPYSNAQTLDRLLTDQGVPHVLISYPNSGHGLDKDKNSADQYYAAFVDYAAKYLK
ncbi:MAG: prolyl oligopeptidase family serine peptidase, partial [Clostridia bacterium]|nr:prolyl oligopeptidase family serine peptidase [Clostridia bacterium]